MLLEYEKQQNAMMITQNEFAKTRPYLGSEMGEYAFQLGFEEGVKFTKNQFIEMVWKFLDDLCDRNFLKKDDVFERFKKAMEE